MATARAPVMVLADPGDSPGCVARHDLGHGVAVCLPQPGPGSAQALAGDLLIALGKFPGALAAEHLSRRGRELAGLWLRAEQVQHLVVLRADRLPARCWTSLAALAAAAGTRLWLVVHQAAAAPGQLAALAPPAGRPQAGPRPWRAALAILPGPGNTGPAFPAVPDVEFPLFRAAARRLLDPAAFAHVANTSHSSTGANCVEVARTRSAKIAVRDFRNPDGRALSFSPPDKWQTLVAKVQAMGSDS